MSSFASIARSSICPDYRRVRGPTAELSAIARQGFGGWRSRCRVSRHNGISRLGHIIRDVQPHLTREVEEVRQSASIQDKFLELPSFLQFAPEPFLLLCRQIGKSRVGLQCTKYRL